MNLLFVGALSIEAVKVIRFARYNDHRGYFTETFRKSDFLCHPDIPFMKNVSFCQSNESFSRAGTVRGLHFQWNPFQGKLVRTIFGRMIDIALDIRIDSPTFGSALMYDMPSKPGSSFAEWIWVPPGFAHGNFFTEDTVIEYYCSGEYNPTGEASISPLCPEIKWNFADPALRYLFNQIAYSTRLITEKDKNGFSLTEWQKMPESKYFSLEFL
jgi:dTDP-4-dehydrorhamnose 3,5-epimerase